jgi:protein-S-isoprenylcysteine O-methyltransferase Ste14
MLPVPADEKPSSKPFVPEVPMTDADPQGGERSSAGAAIRFPLPPLLFAIPLAVALAMDRWVLRLPLPVGGRGGTRAAGAALAVGGTLFSFSGVLTVLRHGTTVVPHHAVTRLVTTGPFRLTRNPMYTGHLIVLLGATLRAGSWWPLLVAPLCIRATTRLVIIPEEDYLARKFGEDYQNYRARVRRWI